MPGSAEMRREQEREGAAKQLGGLHVSLDMPLCVLESSSVIRGGVQTQATKVGPERGQLEYWPVCCCILGLPLSPSREVRFAHAHM